MTKIKDGVYRCIYDRSSYVWIDKGEGLYFDAAPRRCNYVDLFLRGEKLWRINGHRHMKEIEQYYTYVSTYEEFCRILPLEML